MRKLLDDVRNRRFAGLRQSRLRLPLARDLKDVGHHKSRRPADNAGLRYNALDVPAGVIYG